MIFVVALDRHPILFARPGAKVDHFAALGAERAERRFRAPRYRFRAARVADGVICPGHRSQRKLEHARKHNTGADFHIANCFRLLIWLPSISLLGRRWRNSSRNSVSRLDLKEHEQTAQDSILERMSSEG